MDVIVHNSRFLDAYEDGATSMDIVAKTRELKKRHRATLVMPDDLKSKVYRRRRRVKEDTEEIECEDGDGGDQDIGCLHELQLLETQLLAREATPAEQIVALTRLSTLEVNCSFLSDPGPIIVYPSQSLTHSLTH